MSTYEKSPKRASLRFGISVSLSLVWVDFLTLAIGVSFVAQE